jgi:hypothetical protein
VKTFKLDGLRVQVIGASAVVFQGRRRVASYHVAHPYYIALVYGEEALDALTAQAAVDQFRKEYQ